ARFLYQEAFEFTPQFKLWLGTNHKPQITGTDEGIWRRVVEIPFAAFFPEDVRDEQMPEKLRAEGAGILRWMVQGALSWQKIGLAKPSVVRQATESYRDSEDVLKHYLQERTVLGKDFWVYDQELYSSYRNWCENNKE